MKICDLTQAYTPTGGGIKTYLHEKREYVKKHRDDEHILIVPGEEDRVIRKGKFSTFLVASPLVRGCEPYRFINRSDKVLAILRAEKPEVIELGDAYLLPWVAFCYRRSRPCGILGFYHTDFPTAYVESVMARSAGKMVAKLAKNLASRYARWIYNHCDFTITSSRALQAKLREMGIPRVEYIPLGVDLNLFHPSKRDLRFRQNLGLTEEDILLIYTGRLDYEKRVDVMIAAFEKLPTDFKGALVIIGDGPMKESIIERARQNSRLLIFPYETDRAMLANLLASADIYVTAAPHETFGLSVIEAQACGLPVVGVKAGAMVERVPEAVGELSPVNSAEGLAAKVMELAANGYRQRGKNARRLVETEFSWERTFQKLFAFYEHLHLINKVYHGV